MEEKIALEDLRIVKIKEAHALTTFTSYEKELANFLVEDALHNQKNNLSIPFLWFHQERLAVYITLLTDKINLEGDLRELFQEKGVQYKSLPALKIGRLCVDDSFLRKGLGKLMVKFAIEKAEEINLDKAGCRFITVDAKNSSVGFYQKTGFRTLEQRKNETTAMYLDFLFYLDLSFQMKDYAQVLCVKNFQSPLPEHLLF